LLDRNALYDPELVSSLARRRFVGPPSPHPQRGPHLSHQKGASLEFSEHTEYNPGDDLKHLDWKVFAKTDRYYVRRFEDERLARVMIVLDASASMLYGGEGDELAGSKYQLAARVAVALAACLLRQGDAVGVSVACEEPFFVMPRPGTAQLDAIIETLGRQVPAGRAELGTLCESLAAKLGRSTVVIAVSDFLDEAETDLIAFGLLRARGVLPSLVHILHHDEIDLPFEQTFRFQALESEANITLDPEAVRQAYQEEMRWFVEGLKARAASLGMPYTLVRDTDEAAKRLGAVMPRLRAG
jgi:uncharacterized protein (DUF58 family)